MKTHFQVTFPQEPGASFPIAASNGRTLPIRARPDVRPTNFPTRILTRDEWDDLRRPAGPYQAAYQPKRPVPDVDFEAEDGSLHKTAEACLAHELKARFGVETLAEVEAKMRGMIQDMNRLADMIPKEDIELDPEKTPSSATLDDSPPQASQDEIAYYPSLPPKVSINAPKGPILGDLPQQYQAEDGSIHKTAGEFMAHVLMVRFGVDTLDKLEAQMKAIADKAKLTVGDCQEALAEAQPPKASQAEAVRLLASALSRRGLKPAEAAKATGLTSQECRAVVKANPKTFRESAGRLYLND